MAEYLINGDNLSLVEGARKSDHDDLKADHEAVKVRVNTAENDINVLEGRVDNITNLPAGSTAGDAELTDIRVGANGVTYPNAGDSVRNQVSDLQEALQNNGLQYKNIIGMEGGKPYPAIIPTGTKVTMSTADRTALGQSGLNLQFLDENKNVIGYWNFSSGAWYRTITTYNNERTSYYVQWDITPIKDVQVEIGDKVTPYVPYHPSIDNRISEATEILKSIKTYYNWFEPNARYLLRNADDSQNRNGITINNDGSILCTRYQADYGQLMIKSADVSKKLLAGTYVISARVTINENITVADRNIALRLGFSNSPQYVKMKTERGGTTDTAEKVGWVSASFDIAEEEIFAFEILPRNEITSANYPITFDQIMITNSEILLPYSNEQNEARDLTARAAIKVVEDQLNEIPSNILLPTDIFNGEPYEGSYDWQTPVVNYGALFKGVENVESFAFFTDPHVMGFEGRNEPYMHEYIKKISKVFRSVPCAFTVCGGDWLNNNTIADEACYRLGYIKALADNMLCGCKLVLGNHDTNYQGKADAESERYTGTLTNETIAALMFYDTETRKAYYSFDGIRSKCYVLDTGIEHSSMLAYDWEQVAWLAERLAEDDPEHAIIFLHIILNNGNIQTNTSNFASIVEAYNNHSTVELNGVTYDFTSCTGHVDLWVGGHTHVDSTGTLGGIPYIIAATLSYNSNVPLIDLVLVDYDNNVVKTIRAGGTGINRTVPLVVS